LHVTDSERNFELVYEFGIAVIKENVIYQWIEEVRDAMSKADKIFIEN
jgi:translation initiation factor IF-2